MDVTIIHGAAHTYVCIKNNRATLDVPLEHGMSPQGFLRKRAQELRDEAEHKLFTAKLMVAAAGQIELGRAMGVMRP